MEIIRHADEKTADDVIDESFGKSGSHARAAGQYIAHD